MGCHASASMQFWSQEKLCQQSTWPNMGMLVWTCSRNSTLQESLRTHSQQHAPLHLTPQFTVQPMPWPTPSSLLPPSLQQDCTIGCTSYNILGIIYCCTGLVQMPRVEVRDCPSIAGTALSVQPTWHPCHASFELARLLIMNTYFHVSCYTAVIVLDTHFSVLQSLEQPVKFTLSLSVLCSAQDLQPLDPDFSVFCFRIPRVRLMSPAPLACMLALADQHRLEPLLKMAALVIVGRVSCGRGLLAVGGRTGGRGRRHFSPLAWYNKQIDKSPIITKSITSGGEIAS